MSVRIQLMSDVHLETRFVGDRLPGEDWRHAPKDLGADVLVLAGDVGSGAQGVRWAARQADRLGIPVVFVPGNHEFYGLEVRAARDRMREAAEGTGVHVLDNDRVELAGARFVGTTLWTGFAAYRPDPVHRMREQWHAFEQARRTMRDYHAISIRDGDRERPLDPSDTFAWHKEAVRWLEQALTGEKMGPVPQIVVTHHAPAEICRIPWAGGLRRGDADNSYWTPLERMFETYSIRAWFHGHLHAAVDTTLRGVRLASNPLGYPGQRGTGYDPDKVLIVDSGEEVLARRFPPEPDLDSDF